MLKNKINEDSRSGAPTTRKTISLAIKNCTFPSRPIYATPASPRLTPIDAWEGSFDNVLCISSLSTSKNAPRAVDCCDTPNHTRAAHKTYPARVCTLSGLAAAHVPLWVSADRFDCISRSASLRVKPWERQIIETLLISELKIRSWLLNKRMYNMGIVCIKLWHRASVYLSCFANKDYCVVSILCWWRGNIITLICSMKFITLFLLRLPFYIDRLIRKIYIHSGPSRFRIVFPTWRRHFLYPI